MLLFFFSTKKSFYFSRLVQVDSTQLTHHRKHYIIHIYKNISINLEWALAMLEQHAAYPNLNLPQQDESPENYKSQHT